MKMKMKESIPLPARAQLTTEALDGYISPSEFLGGAEDKKEESDLRF